VSRDRRRAAGLLLHPTSLPGRHGIGELGPEAHAFLDFCESAGQRLWQVLPLGPVGDGYSPYSSHSAFAGNPLLVSPARLAEEGLLDEDELARAPEFPLDRVDFEKALAWKEALLRQAHARLLATPGSELHAALAAFRSAPEQASWLEDWCLFWALKRRHGGTAWSEWPAPLRRREKKALAAARDELRQESDHNAFVQFLFFRQWRALHDAARAKGIEVLGDLPMYVAHDSADVWSHPELFDLDEDLEPIAVAGVPPDYFSKTGQLWGNPLYRWQAMEKDGFAWWIERMRANLRVADIVRIDHFRAFASYWAVPAGEETAVNGRWVEAPGRAVFRALEQALPNAAIVAEDLGYVTPDVTELLEATGFPRMTVLQFAFWETDDPFLPHNHRRNSVVYTGTHDNETTRGWWGSLNETDRARVLDYLGADPREIEWSLIRMAYNSVAERAVVPLQDVLGLGNEARMNTPAVPNGNWAWRARAEHFRPELAARLRRLAVLSGRAKGEA
jgi:4-alpha-glucanotransferase